MHFRFSTAFQATPPKGIRGEAYLLDLIHFGSEITYLQRQNLCIRESRVGLKTERLSLSEKPGGKVDNKEYDLEGCGLGIGDHKRG